MLKNFGRGKRWIGPGLIWLSLIWLLMACGDTTSTVPATTAPATTAVSTTTAPATTTATSTTVAAATTNTNSASNPAAPSGPAATNGTPGTVQNIQVQMNTPFQLRPGRTAVIKQENFSVEFLGVTQDSRCPQGANCIRAGDVTVQVRLKKDNDVTTATMTLPGQNQNRQYASLGAYGVELLAVNPRPRLDSTTPGASGVSIPLADYSIDLVVRPAA